MLTKKQQMKMQALSSIQQIQMFLYCCQLFVTNFATLYILTQELETKGELFTFNLYVKKSIEIFWTLLGLHAFTGCDVNSAFVQKGKIKLLNVLLKKQEFTTAFKELGQSSEVSENVLDMLERFVCCLFYGKPSYTSTNKLRYDLVQQKYLVKGQRPLSSNAGLDISLLPPCREALKNHTLIANYQAMIWKQADIAQPEIPDPVGNGWKQDTNGILSIE